MQEVMRLVEQVAPSSASVLITGETGSGKEILARTLHQLSPRADRPFVAINCSAIPESLMESEIFGHERGAFTGAAERRIGCFELADGGTLLLDEIGEMPAPTQAKLLRVLEDRKVRRLGSKTETPVDVRVLAATNKDPEQAVAHGALAAGPLFPAERLSHSSAASARTQGRFARCWSSICCATSIAKHGRQVRGINAEVIELFQSYPWPGNVRELRNVLERAAIVCDRGPDRPAASSRRISAARMRSRPPNCRRLRFPVGTTVDAVERELILQTLAATTTTKRAPPNCWASA